MSTFQLWPRIEVDFGSPSKISTSVVDVSACGICDMTSSSLVIHLTSFKLHLLRLFQTFW